MYEREVLAPGAGHRGASGLISVQVIRQTGGALQAGTWCSGRRQTDWDWERGEAGRGRGLWERYIPAGVGLFSRGTPAALDRHARGR